MLSQGYKGLRNQVTHVHVTALQTAGSARSDLDRVRDRVPNRFGLGKQKVPTTLALSAKFGGRRRRSSVRRRDEYGKVEQDV